MMRIQVKLFATLRQYMPPGTPGDACDIVVPAGTTVIEVLSQLGVPLDQPSSMVVLVNGRQSNLRRVVEEEDVVSAFPAMAGG